MRKNMGLYRGKRVDNGAWETGSLVIIRRELSDEQVYIADKMTGYLTPVAPETVGECTGIPDKNQRLIHEGDIFKDSLGYISVVEWCDDGRFLGFAINRKVSGYMHGGRVITYIDKDPSVEVIGNVVDNPELLEVEQ